ncbi:sensor histidine kinase [Candidatus Palauibacter polyketidifaciens]|uniref:ATP-binding protein n=1 Tax=Candidatus Palauibacter polyketidifaciens TaxID=3056740 RepID=UPI0023A3169A|nr:sensor histidine kinase [Candidatus Palauibacter polyketidifaciens]MDE2719528.1 sensor histidine kinase [Candidatus Palauibacter polyketidifaciens]
MSSVTEDPRFTVDTHLFRELGELLVGRDSTALIELIKNSYDADATEVLVHGESLDDPRSGRIVVTDNGVGMTRDQFISGFLRVASRFKELGTRRSTRFGRRYTGVKGIGRLAAHKLARRLEVESVTSGTSPTALHAVIDWDKIEGFETLDDIPPGTILFGERAARPDALSGTTLTLSQLRRKWTESERSRFLAEISSFQAPDFIRDPLPENVIPAPLLFERPEVRDIGAPVESSPLAGFRVVLDGDFETGDDYWELVADLATWVVEMRAAPGSSNVVYAIAPTRRTLEENPDARGYSNSLHRTISSPCFDARILIREGHLRARQDQRVWAARASGVHVFLEGFRVLPYGDDDWLSIDSDYTRRPRQLELLRDLDFSAEWGDKDVDAGLTRLPKNNYFGGVFLTQEHAPTLRILVNREGFVPEAGFLALVDHVRTGVDLCTRVRAAAGLAERQKRAAIRAAAREAKLSTAATRSLRVEIEDAKGVIKEIHSLLSQRDLEGAESLIDRAAVALEHVRDRADTIIWEGAMLRILASVGTQMAAFVHEVNGVLGTAQTLDQSLKVILEEGALLGEERRRLQGAWRVAVDLRQTVERHASYLTDVVSVNARRRRSRQSIAERFDSAVRLVRHSAERYHVEILSDIPPALKSPPMFPAELSTIFANLLTNAVKAAKPEGRIHASAASDSKGVRVRVQNTGVAVALAEAERWFRPFESTTDSPDSMLGQGMGLGLTITRSMLEYYGLGVQFVEPSPPYATAVEVRFSK